MSETSNTAMMLSNIVRVGLVSSIDVKARTVRVMYPDRGNDVSGDLRVLQHPLADVSVRENGLHTHQIRDTYTGNGNASTEGLHSHEAHVTYWMPKIGDWVVVLYEPVLDGDGFILGVL